MRTLIVLVCFCAVAYGQQPSQYEQNLNSEVNSNYYADSGTVTPPLAFSRSNELRGRYRATPNEYNEKSTPREVISQECQEKNERYPVPGSCDRYIECLNGTATEKLCPDGLRFNPNVRYNVYPCQYPIDVPCLERSALQPAQPTENCPHQFGYYKIGDARNCSGFRNCVHGVAHDFVCPEGLAFSSSNYRCEWPDEVEDCDSEAFLGFRCPEVPESKELGPPAGYRTYRSPLDCQIYFICINGRPRRLTCGGFAAFDELTGSCIAADQIPECPEELRNSAARSREAEIERQTVQDAYEKFKYERKLLKLSASTLQPLFSELELGTKYPEQD